MSAGYRICEQNAPHFLTLQVVEWVDIFTRQSYKDLIVENLKYCQKNKGLEIFAYVIMTNHIHLIVRSNTNPLSNTIRDFKSFTSKELLKLIDSEQESRREWILRLFSNAARRHDRNSSFQIWSHDNHPEQLWSEKFTKQKTDYIHMNPVKAGWVSKPEDYLYSSARNYAGLDSPLEVKLLSFNWNSLY